MSDAGGGGKGAAKAGSDASGVAAQGVPYETVVMVPAVDLTDGKGGVSYVVQVAGSGKDAAVWRDVARVTVPVRSKRRTIISAAVGAMDGLLKLPAVVRVLDDDAAREHRVELKQVDPELVIG